MSKKKKIDDLVLLSIAALMVTIGIKVIGDPEVMEAGSKLFDKMLIISNPSFSEKDREELK